MQKPLVAVIGAGISGLTTAWLLRNKGFNVQVFEKNDYAGGSIVTEKEGEWLIDLGPNSTLETSQELRQMVDDLGLQEEKVYANPLSDNRFIVRDGQLHVLPLKPGAFLKTSLFSWKAKLRLFKEPFIPPTQAEDVSLADFVRYRLGDEFLDYAINPFVAGVYAGDPEQLSTAAGFAKLWALEQKYGGLIKGMFKGAKERKKRNEVAKDRAKMFSFVNGMRVLPDALSETLGDVLHLETEVKSIRKNDQGFELVIEHEGQSRQENFDRVVVSVPTYVQSSLLKELIGQESAQLDEVAYPPVAVVFLGFKRDDVHHPLNGFGFLVPEKEGRQILGTIFSSTLFPARAPQDYVALTTFVGGTRQPENALLSDEQLLKLVLNDLRDLLGIGEKPAFVRIRKWPKAIPQYKVGYAKIQQLFNDWEERFAGLYFAGNFRRGISLGDSVLCAHETVEKMEGEGDKG